MTLGAARVIYRIQDLSLYVDELLRGYIVVLVHTERGPVWEPTPAASLDEYERLFGRTFAGSLDPLVLKTGLLQGAKFVVIRCVHLTDPGDASTMTAVASTITLDDEGGVALPGWVESAAGPFSFTQALSGRVTGTEVGPFTFGAGTSDQFKVKVGSGDPQTVTLSGSLVTPHLAADLVNAGTNGLTASATADNRFKLRANNPADSLEIMAVENDAYSVLGFTEAVYAATAGTDRLVVGIAGGADQVFTLTPSAGEEGPFSLTAGQVSAQLVGLLGGASSAASGKLRITTTATGPDASVQVRPASTARTALGFDTNVHSGAEGDARPTLRFTAADPGVWGDAVRIHIHESDLHPDTSFDVRVSYRHQSGLNEYFTDVDMDPESQRYVVNYVNERSRLVRVTDLFSENPAPANRPAVNDLGTLMSGGDDGLEGFRDSDWIGDPFAQTGMYAADKTDLAIDIMIPGTTSITVLQHLVAYCEDRGDLLAYANTPVGLGPMEAKKWRMGELPYTHEAFNSHRLSLWFGRPLVYDSRDDSRKLIPNLGHLASCLSRTDTDYDYFYAPVGPKRGVVDFVEGLDFNMADFRGYQDMFAEYGMNYLMMCRDKPIEGAVFWEQRTTQRASSATRDLNVMRFLVMMRKVLVPILRTFLFDPNHPMTWREVYRTLEPRFRLWKAQGAVYDFVLQCDQDAFFDGGELKNAVLNSGLEIDQGIYRARGLIQPTRAIYYLEFEVGVMRTGEAFSTYTGMKELPGWVRR